MIDYTVAFCSRLLEWMDFSDAEALTRYVDGLKQGTKDWVLIHDPSCKGVLSTLARGIALCSTVLGTLHHGMMPWGRRCQKGYLLVPWYLYGTTTAVLHKPSGLVAVPWAHLELAE